MAPAGFQRGTINTTAAVEQNKQSPSRLLSGNFGRSKSLSNEKSFNLEGNYVVLVWNTEKADEPQDLDGDGEIDEFDDPEVMDEIEREAEAVMHKDKEAGNNNMKNKHAAGEFEDEYRRRKRTGSEKFLYHFAEHYVPAFLSLAKSPLIGFVINGGHGYGEQDRENFVRAFASTITFGYLSDPSSETVALGADALDIFGNWFGYGWRTILAGTHQVRMVLSEAGL